MDLVLMQMEELVVQVVVELLDLVLEVVQLKDKELQEQQTLVAVVEQEIIQDLRMQAETVVLELLLLDINFSS